MKSGLSLVKSPNPGVSKEDLLPCHIPGATGLQKYEITAQSRTVAENINPENDCFLIVAAVYDNLDCSDVMDSPHFSIATKLLEVMGSHLLLVLSVLPEHTDKACLCGVFMYGCTRDGHVPFFLLTLRWCWCRCLSELGDL